VSKLRVSFSAFLMLIVISMFSAVAFAAVPTAPTGLDASITSKQELRATWNKVGTQTSVTGYKVFINDVEKATGIAQPTDASKITVVNSPLISIATDLAANPKTIFKIDVVAVNADGDSSKTTVNVAIGANGTLVKVAADTDSDNGINNANQSGVNVGGQNVNTGVLKSGEMVDNHGKEGAQRTHGEYQNNTNSCASCHQTHTASAKSLLFKDGVYSTCTACHDGTLGFYNVFGNGDKASSAGTFGGTHEGNMSVHLADGAVKMKAAPGGNPNGTGTWDKEFNCASCHSPHGSYSDRLLHYNPNNMAASTPAEGGIKAGGYKADTKVAVLPFADRETGTTRFIGVKGTKTEHGLTGEKYDFIPAGDVVVMIYEKAPGATSYSKTTTPWMYGYPQRGSGTDGHYYYSRFFTEDPSTGLIKTNGTYADTNKLKVIDHYDYLDNSAHIKYAYGLMYGAPGSVVDSAKFAEVARAYVVKLDLMPILDPAKDLTNVGKLDSGEELTFGDVKITTVNQRALFAGDIYPANLVSNPSKYAPYYNSTKLLYEGMGVAMSGYCASCHTDYLAKSGSATGTFDTTSFRHTTNSDTYTCVRCHFAHGTDVEVMTDAHLRNKAKVAEDLVADPTTEFTPAQAAELANDYLLDKGASSALKRFTNMSVCWSCHTSSKAEQLKNTDSYKYDNGNAMYDPRGIPTTEGTVNWPK
jgi:predicted CXXCH cytochrome family protein